MRENELDRRAFVMGSVGFGMAVLGGGMLVGCASEGGSGAGSGAEDPAGAASKSEPLAPAPDDDADASAAMQDAGKALVAVFSLSGNTLSVAERIRDMTGADLFRIETTNAYPDDYDQLTAQVQRENAEGFVPELAAAVPNWDEYGTVYLGHPIWWGHLPNVMRAFLLQHDLAGKAVAPFCTSGGSGIEGALADVRALYPEANLLESLALTRGSLPGALDEVRPWVEKLRH